MITDDNIYKVMELSKNLRLIACDINQTLLHIKGENPSNWRGDYFAFKRAKLDDQRTKFNETLNKIIELSNEPE